MKFKLGENVDIKTIKGIFRGEIIYFDDEVITLLNEENGEIEISIKDIIKEDKMEKTFQEVIRDIKEGEVWVQTKENCVTRKISCVQGEIILGLSQYRSSFGTLGSYSLQRKKVTFQEAFAAYEEGKEIQSVSTGLKCKKRRLPYDTKVKDYCYYDDIIFTQLKELKAFGIKEIRGSWYINE